MPDYNLSPEKWAQLIELLDGCNLWQWEKVKDFIDGQFKCEIGKTQLPDLSVLEERIAHRLKFDS